MIVRTISASSAIAEVDGFEQSMLDRLLSLGGEWDIALLRQLTDSYTACVEAHFRPGFDPGSRPEWIRAPHCKAEGDYEIVPTNRDRAELHRSRPSEAQHLLHNSHKAECFRAESDRPAWRRSRGSRRIRRKAATIHAPSTRTQPRAARARLQILGSRGEMELWLAFVDEQAVSVQIDFVIDDRVSDTISAPMMVLLCVLNPDLSGAAKRVGGGVARIRLSQRRGTLQARAHKRIAIDLPPRAHRRTARGWLAYGLLVAARGRG